MKKLITEFLNKYKSKDIPNDKLADLLLSYIRVGKHGWYLNLNDFDNYEEDKQLIEHAESEW